MPTSLIVLQPDTHEVTTWREKSLSITDGACGHIWLNKQQKANGTLMRKTPLIKNEEEALRIDYQCLLHFRYSTEAFGRGSLLWMYVPQKTSCSLCCNVNSTQRKWWSLVCVMQLEKKIKAFIQARGHHNMSSSWCLCVSLSVEACVSLFCFVFVCNTLHDDDNLLYSWGPHVDKITKIIKKKKCACKCNPVDCIGYGVIIISHHVSIQFSLFI